MTRGLVAGVAFAALALAGLALGSIVGLLRWVNEIDVSMTRAWNEYEREERYL